VEWSEQVEGALPEDTIFVTIARCAANDSWRTITMEGVDLL
jgi:tRNA A37 threonylcarbamoyladenosine biosynthesis protein TsaE